jgi:hypothetical protein
MVIRLSTCKKLFSFQVIWFKGGQELYHEDPAGLHKERITQVRPLTLFYTVFAVYTVFLQKYCNSNELVRTKFETFKIYGVTKSLKNTRICSE